MMELTTDQICLLLVVNTIICVVVLIGVIWYYMGGQE